MIAMRVWFLFLVLPVLAHAQPVGPPGPIGNVPALPQSATSAGNPNGSVAFTVNGPMNIFAPFPYGGGTNMAGLCIQMPFTNTQPCPINAGETVPWGAALTGEQASTGLQVFNSGAPNDFGAGIGAMAGTFTATTFVPTTPLTAPQIALLRVGMTVRSSDARYGQITGWAGNGTSVTVSNFYAVGSQTPTTPAGGTATINGRDKIFGADIAVQLNAGNQEVSMVSTEFDCVNSTGAFDSVINADTGCVDVVNFATSAVGYGYRIHSGPFFNFMLLEGTYTNAGIEIASPTSTNPAIYLYTGGDAVQVASPSNIFGRWLGNGNIYIGNEVSGTSSPTIDFFSSGTTPFSPDGSIVATGGSGTLGTSTLALNFAAVKLSVGSTVSGLPTCNTAAKGFKSWVTDATTPTYNATLVGGGAVAVPAFCNGTNWTAH